MVARRLFVHRWLSLPLLFLAAAALAQQSLDEAPPPVAPPAVETPAAAKPEEANPEAADGEEAEVPSFDEMQADEVIGGPQSQSDDPAGYDFIQEARLLYRVAACSGADPLPPEIDPRVVEAHCKKFRKSMSWYHEVYLPKVRAFLDGWLPGTLPTSVVYPFGGGDLITALTTYPQAQEFTTLSLELAADPRRLTKTSMPNLKLSLDRLRKKIGGLLRYSDSRTDNLQIMQRGPLAGQVTFFMVGLAVHRCEPIRVRFFQIQPDGSLHYLSAPDIRALERKRARKMRNIAIAKDPDFSVAFSNVETEFRCDGGVDAPIRVHRHIAADLSDPVIGKNLLAYLGQRGRIAAMTKAASYLLWRESFSKIRSYLLANMELMVSDSTGIPPAIAAQAGFVQETAGTFRGSFLRASPVINEQFRKLWRSQPERKMTFRYGYIDASKQFHMMVTLKKRDNP